MENQAKESLRVRPDLDLVVLSLIEPLAHESVCRVAPDLPWPMLQSAHRTFLNLEAGEIILAVLGRNDSMPPIATCVLTTRGVHFPGKRIQGTGDGLNPAMRSRSVAYPDLPESIETSRFPSTLDFVEATGTDKTRIVVANFKVRVAFKNFLTRMRAVARGEETLTQLSAADLARLSAKLYDANLITARVRDEQTEVRAFAGRFLTTSKAIVTPAIIAACVLVFLVMTVRGVSPMEPKIEDLLAWGANFGPSVVIDHQYWRIFTCMFLHIGIIHILMNMWALAASGPVVERMFGHFGFAVIYLFSGLGGALASLGYHPLLVSAGASGAIFGVFGALLGMLFARKSEVPVSVFKPMTKSMIGFLGYNLVFGLTVPNIDMAAHVGGLIVGFVTGLVLASASKVAPQKRVLAKGSAALLLGSSLCAIAYVGEKAVGERLKNDPMVAKLDAGPAWNEFSQAAAPLLTEIDAIQADIQKILVRDNFTPEEIGPLDALSNRSHALSEKLAPLPARNPEIRAMLARLVSAVKHQGDALDAMKKFARTQEPGAFEGPQGSRASFAAYLEDIKSFQAMSEDYFRKNELTRVNK